MKELAIHLASREAQSPPVVPGRPPEVAVIGAGPYGLSVAAHLRRSLATVVIGRPMEFWQEMPRGMFLRSAISASSLSAPGGAYSLQEYGQVHGIEIPSPIPLDLFVDYAMWFQRHAVPEVRATYVRSLDRRQGAFELELEDGEALRVPRVVVAVGIKSFARVPELAAALPGGLATHTQEHRDFSVFAGKRVAVVGGGQSALECAALLAESGADVEVIARRELRWLRAQSYAGPGHQLLHAPSDVGPPGLNWLIHFSGMFSRYPARVRRRIARRATRPAGARWLHDRVVGKVRLTVPATVVSVTPQSTGLRLELSDGSERDVDHLLFGTGFRPSVDRVPFLSSSIRSQLREQDGFPVLDDRFESSVPGLHFVGGLADRSYGPICRFVSGAGPTARRVLAAARSGPPR